MNKQAPKMRRDPFPFFPRLLCLAPSSHLFERLDTLLGREGAVKLALDRLLLVARRNHEEDTRVKLVLWRIEQEEVHRARPRH